MTAVMERSDQAKSAAERDLYDETPQTVLDAFKELGFATDEERAQLASLSELPAASTDHKLHWIQLRAI